MYPSRQRFTVGEGKDRQALVLGKKLSDFGLKDGSVLMFKDLGPQISWRTVFLVEYAGPIFIYMFFYMRFGFVYGSGAGATPHTFTSNLAMALWVFHYAKREFETVFVHRFGNDTMPILNIFKNSGYYWGAAAGVAYFVNHPLFTPPPLPLTYCCAALFVLFELSNGYCHLILRNLRRPGTRERNIPQGFLFEYVSCANYTFEVLSWVAFSFMTLTVASFAFTAVGFAQMYVWAVAKHKRYRKEFPNYPKKRTAMIPFIA